MPAEWTSHAACLILYPHNAAVFRLSKARPQVEQVARTIASAGQEKVILYCQSLEDQAQLQKHVQDEPNIHVQVCPSNDTWARDTAPTFVREQSEDGQQLIGLDWDFNAYGGPEEGCYWPCDLDCQIASVICKLLAKSVPRLMHRKVNMILEGGSIHSDGEGSILTTEECLLNRNRNPNLSKTEIESRVLSALGGSKMIWLERGLAFDDDTNGHIDNFACFVRPGHIVLAWTDDETNDPENCERCRQALQTLEQCTDAKARHLTIHKLHLPSPMFYSQEEANSLPKQIIEGTPVASRTAGDRMAASYVNFYVANNAVIVPQFGDTLFDVKAIETLSKLFPGRQVVGVQSREILIGGGNIHCITQQVPSNEW